MVVDCKYNIGDFVYLLTDEEQSPRIITSIQINPSGLLYRLSRGTEETWHYDIEIIKEKTNAYL